METITTIKLNTKTKRTLDKFREYKNESYDEVVNKLVSIVNNFKHSPQLSKETIEHIEKARERIKAGNYLSEEEAMKRLGFW